MPRERRAADDLAELVHPERQVALRRDRCVLLAQAAGRGVARVDEQPGAGRLGLLVHPLEAGDRQVHLAAHLEHLGHRTRFGVFRSRGTAPIVATLAVTSSPTRPSPRVAACTYRPPS